MTLKRFTKDFLHNICCKYNITLLRSYNDNELGAQKFIDFKCINCNANTSKRFEYIEKYTPICHTCSDYEGRKTLKNTIILRYGVENISQSEQIKNKKKETTLKNYGVEHNSKSLIIKKKKVDTCLKNNGVEYPQQSKRIKSKSKQTCLQNYGVEHPMQNEKIMEIVSKKCYKQKTYIYPSGKEIQCQGYEPFALDELVKNINEDDILTGCKNVPTIWYYDTNGKEHRHYVDIFIPNQNKCIEVKSTWTLKKTKSNIFEKQEAGKKLGYEYEIWVYDAKGNRVETHT